MSFDERWHFGFDAMMRGILFSCFREAEIFRAAATCQRAADAIERCHCRHCLFRGASALRRWRYVYACQI